MNEQNLGGIISQAVEARLTPDYVEEQVQVRVDKLIDEAVEKALRSYSETGKLIKQAVAEALKVDKLDLPSYGHVVTGALKRLIEANVSELVAGRLSADMEEMLGLAPKTVKLSQIAEAMLEQHDEGYGDMITVIVQPTRYGSTWLYLDEDQVIAESDKYQAAVRLLISEDGTVASATIDSHDLKKSEHIGRAYGLEKLVRAYVACGTKIELDEDFVQTGKGDY